MLPRQPPRVVREALKVAGNAARSRLDGSGTPEPIQGQVLRCRPEAGTEVLDPLARPGPHDPQERLLEEIFGLLGRDTALQEPEDGAEVDGERRPPLRRVAILELERVHLDNWDTRSAAELQPPADPGRTEGAGDFSASSSERGARTT